MLPEESALARVERLRKQIIDDETSGAVISTPCTVVADAGTTYTGYTLHGDHAADDRAHLMTVRYAQVQGQYLFDEPVWSDPEDRLGVHYISPQ